MKEFLSRAGHTFTTRMIDEDDAAYDALIALGYRTVPVTVIGDQTVQGFNPAALTRALAISGPPPPGQS